MQYTERELIQRAIRTTLSRGYAVGQPRWTAVKNLFGVGQNEAQVICENYGFDPDAVVGLLDYYPNPTGEKR
jgi:hypothetical protein